MAIKNKPKREDATQAARRGVDEATGERAKTGSLSMTADALTDLFASQSVPFMWRRLNFERELLTKLQLVEQIQRHEAEYGHGEWRWEGDTIWLKGRDTTGDGRRFAEVADDY